ncbi:hypothetical protein JI435_407630 [Parastagonospora nodorum SN15]|uniref:Uncharacterized protein n=1 Tax=Phaeosphaeria nodorum (strain SN15 / ATCC MYA-4574 / FGSC 10173) TaxID=321614 RepID=A0A7U2EZ99_PHANO|nr:hypothetical protein JI435_407630 [Parastagonospora nodorum SN15]
MVLKPYSLAFATGRGDGRRTQLGSDARRSVHRWWARGYRRMIVELPWGREHEH